jgi:hypothetical protein
MIVLVCSSGRFTFRLVAGGRYKRAYILGGNCKPQPSPLDITFEDFTFACGFYIPYLANLMCGAHRDYHVDTCFEFKTAPAHNSQPS